MWEKEKLARVLRGDMNEGQRKVLEQSVEYWNNCLFAFEVMKNDAPNPEDQRLMVQIMKHLSDRRDAMAMAISRTSILMPGSSARN
jgi:hypothetical protein